MNSGPISEATECAALLMEKGLRLALAESCTGGLLGHKITNVEGSSAFFTGAVVAYANSAKEELLGVPGDIIREFGAVSSECAELMAKGARERLKSDIGVAITGIAGPGGGSPDKPVGTVFIAISGGKEDVTERLSLSGDREEIKDQAARAALKLLIKVLRSEPS